MFSSGYMSIFSSINSLLTLRVLPRVSLPTHCGLGPGCSIPFPSRPEWHSSVALGLTSVLVWNFDMQLLPMLWLYLVLFAAIEVHILLSFVCHKALPCFVLAHLLQFCPYLAQLSSSIFVYSPPMGCFPSHWSNAHPNFCPDCRPSQMGFFEPSAGHSPIWAMQYTQPDMIPN